MSRIGDSDLAEMNREQKMATLRRVCKVHPIVLFSIIDSYERRPKTANRVIGTLLGSVDNSGVVEVTDCFTVPHNEVEDEVAVDIQFGKSMFRSHQQIHGSEVIVGWYSTGPAVTEHSVLIHEYYTREAKNPVHLTVDTTLQNSEMGIKAYISAPMGIPSKTMGLMFVSIPLEITCFEAEKIGLNVMMRGKNATGRPVELAQPMEQMESNCETLLSMLDTLHSYVNAVVSGDKPADPAIGRYLQGLVNAVPKLSEDQYENMLTSNMKDLLMVIYLSNLTKTQITLTEKLTVL